MGTPRGHEGATYLPISESAFPNDGIKLEIKSIMFSLPMILETMD